VQVPAATVDAVRAHPLVRQAMEIFDATSLRVRPQAAPPADAGLGDAASAEPEASALIDGPPEEGSR
jgi:hypothetical protein